MIRSMAIVGVLGVTAAGCTTADPRYYYTDQDCLNRQNTSRVLSTAAGIGLGVVGIPGGGLLVGLATNPHCQAYHLTPEGRERMRIEMERERVRRELPVDTRERPYRPVPPQASGRPLDNIPASTPLPPSAN
jgi:hypothetical protein